MPPPTSVATRASSRPGRALARTRHADVQLGAGVYRGRSGGRSRGHGRPSLPTCAPRTTRRQFRVRDDGRAEVPAVAGPGTCPEPRSAEHISRDSSPRPGSQNLETGPLVFCAHTRAKTTLGLPAGSAAAGRARPHATSPRLRERPGPVPRPSRAQVQSLSLARGPVGVSNRTVCGPVDSRRGRAWRTGPGQAAGQVLDTNGHCGDVRPRPRREPQGPNLPR